MLVLIFWFLKHQLVFACWSDSKKKGLIFLHCSELSELSSQAPYSCPFSLHQVALFYRLHIPFRLNDYWICNKILSAFRKKNTQIKHAKRRQSAFHSDNETHEKKESFCPTLFLIIELQIWRIDLFQGWLSHPLFLVGLGSSIFPLPDKHWCYSQRQVNHWSQKFVRPTSLCYRLLAPLEIRIWFGQTDWYSDLIATSVVGYIICSGQTNATARSSSWQVNFRYGIWTLRQLAIGAKCIQISWTQRYIVALQSFIPQGGVVEKLTPFLHCSDG